MNKVLKLGTISNVVAVPQVCQLEKLKRLVSNALPTLFPYFCYPQQLEKWPGNA